MHRVFLTIGFLTLAVAWLGPLPQLAARAFYAHMIMHMAVVAVAAPFLALGIAGRSFDPVKRFPRLFAPIPASLVELVIVWAWHAPALHHLARHATIGFVAEQGMFLLAGLWVWISAFGGDAKDERSRSGSGVVALLLTSMHMTLLGALLALTPRPLYVHAHEFRQLSALDDQQLGGAIMIAVGGVSYLAGGLWLVVTLLRNKTLKTGATVT